LAIKSIKYDEILWEWPFLSQKPLDTIYLKKDGNYFSTDIKGNVLEQRVSEKIIDKKFGYLLNNR